MVRLDAVSAELARIERVCGRAERVERVDGTVSRVCHAGTLFYLRVEPQYIWLTESNLYSAIVNVESNVSWKAE